LQLTSVAADITKCNVEADRFPDLPPLILLQVKHFQWYRDYENAFTNDAISDDTWLKKTKRRGLLCGDLWNHATISALERIFEAHLYNTAKQGMAGHPP
jgi:hypothetical protein